MIIDANFKELLWAFMYDLSFKFYLKMEVLSSNSLDKEPTSYLSYLIKNLSQRI